MTIKVKEGRRIIHLRLAVVVPDGTDPQQVVRRLNAALYDATISEESPCDWDEWTVGGMVALEDLP